MNALPAHWYQESKLTKSSSSTLVLPVVNRRYPVKNSARDDIAAHEDTQVQIQKVNGHYDRLLLGDLLPGVTALRRGSNTGDVWPGRLWMKPKDNWQEWYICILVMYGYHKIRLKIRRLAFLYFHEIEKSIHTILILKRSNFISNFVSCVLRNCIPRFVENCMEYYNLIFVILICDVRPRWMNRVRFLFCYVQCYFQAERTRTAVRHLFLDKQQCSMIFSQPERSGKAFRFFLI